MNSQDYSGHYLWLALSALVMPLFVGVVAFRSARPYSYQPVQPDASGVDQHLWDHLLHAYVADGLVDYDGLKKDYLFETYIRQLAGAKPEQLDSRQKRLAFHCNAYNALVISGVIRHNIHSTVMDYHSRDDQGFFAAKEYILAGETLSLDTLEHKIIRPTYQDARIHMALVCAAKSCPAIRGEAFTGDRVEQQLEEQASLFANHKVYCSYDEAKQKLQLSPILKWYAEDFESSGGIFAFCAARAKSKTVQAALRGAIAAEVEVAYNKYDWALNTQGKTSQSSGGKQALGSGSVPNE